MKSIKYIILMAATVALSAGARADTTTPTDYGTELTNNLNTINTIWGTVATLMIGVALVTVGVRFFRKTK